MVIIAALLILAGGAVAAMKWLEVGPFASEMSAEVEHVEAPPEDAIYINMEPLVIPVIQGSQAVATIQIQIKLQAAGKEKAFEIKRLMPKISDLFIRDLYAFIPRLLKDKERIDVAILKARLMLMTERKLGKGLLQDILIQSVVDTPIR